MHPVACEAVGMVAVVIVTDAQMGLIGILNIRPVPGAVEPAVHDVGRVMLAGSDIFRCAGESDTQLGEYGGKVAAVRSGVLAVCIELHGANIRRLLKLREH